MHNHTKKSILYALPLLILFCMSKADAKVFILHSYHDTFSWVVEINKAIESVLDAEGIAYRHFYMDTKRKTDEAWKKTIASKAMAAIETYKPSVVIASDDNAQHYVGKSLIGKSDVQLVFCGVNANLEKYGYPAGNVTGILERPYPDQALHVLKTLMPDIRQIAVISDNSPSAALIEKHIQAELKMKGSEQSIHSYTQVSNFTDWKRLIKTMDHDPGVNAFLITVYHTIKDHDSQISVDARTILQWAVNHTRKPIVGLWPHLIYNGGFIAVTVKPSEHGNAAARMAVDIINGKSAGQIPVRVNNDGNVMINLLNNGHISYDTTVDLDLIADVVIR